MLSRCPVTGPQIQPKQLFSETRSCYVDYFASNLPILLLSFMELWVCDITLGNFEFCLFGLVGLFAKEATVLEHSRLNYLFLHSRQTFYYLATSVPLPAWGTVSYSLGWPQTHYVVQNDLEPLNLLPVPPKCWGDRWALPHLAPWHLFTFETWSLQLPRLALNSRSFCLSLPSFGVTGLCHQDSAFCFQHIQI